jgi:folate-dependent phosphoribosylglycinamide formyltransferase PurN
LKALIDDVTENTNGRHSDIVLVLSNNPQAAGLDFAVQAGIPTAVSISFLILCSVLEKSDVPYDQCVGTQIYKFRRIRLKVVEFVQIAELTDISEALTKPMVLENVT